MLSPSRVMRPSRPPSVPLPGLASTIGAEVRGTATGVSISGIVLGSAAVLPGDLFAALPGTSSHGAQFAGAAIAAGAAAILTDPAGAQLIGQCQVPVLVHDQPRAVLGELSAEVYGHPSQHMQVIGITGTSGKTTTAYLTAAALTAAGHKTGLIGTIETTVDGIRVPSALTTPEAPQLQSMFAAMLELGVTAVVMEVSSHALALGRVAGTRFAVGAFTNLSQDHLDFHHSFEEYFAAKARLFDPESAVRARKAVVCVDDGWGRRMASLAGEPVTVATSGTADWSVSEPAPLPGGGQQFVLRGPQLAVTVRLGLPGSYNVANAALAIAAAVAVGVNPHVAAAALAGVAVPGRVERIDRGQDFLAVVDYAHKPAALTNVIATLRAQSAGRVGVVVGAGGDRDTAKRPLMGDAAARGADLVIVTDDNPRTEDPAQIRAAVLAGARAAGSAAAITEIADRAAAIAAAVRWAQPGDVVLIAGKGHETGQEIDGVKYPFDDREVLGQALAVAQAPHPAGHSG